MTNDAAAPNKQQGKKNPVKRADMLTLGDFSVSPASGTIAPNGGVAKINVEYSADVSPDIIYDNICITRSISHMISQSGSIAMETMAIDVSDRNPAEASSGFSYEFLGESCIAGINTTDFNSIFEEQTVVRRLDLNKSRGNVYAIHERVFLFSSVILGQNVEERVKITNNSKVRCVVET